MKTKFNSKKNNIIIKGNNKNQPILKNNTITISSESTTEVNTYRINEKNSKKNIEKFNCLDIISSKLNNNSNEDKETKINKKNINNNQLINDINNKNTENIEHNVIIDNLLDDILEIEGKRILNNLSESIINTIDGRFIINSKKLFSLKYEDSLLKNIFNFQTFKKPKNNLLYNNHNTIDNTSINENNIKINNNNNYFSPQSTKQQSKYIYNNIYLEKDNNLLYNNNKDNHKEFSPRILNPKSLNNKKKILNNKSIGNNKISLTENNISKSSINKDSLNNNNNHSIIRRKTISKIEDNPFPKKKKSSTSFY